MSDKHVYRFNEGNKTMRELLGGKGANLAEMTSIGLPVPPGFTLTTEVCNYYSAHGGYPDGVEAQLEDALKALESDTGKTFGDASDPLLLSVRSGARASMPGMMDTILNLGLNDATVEGVIASTGNARFAYDCYRRFVSMYGDVVLGCKPESDDEGDVFEERLEAMKKAKGVTFDTELTADDLKELVAEFKAAVKERTGKDFPDDPRAQLWGAISAVFGSWGNDRAVAYRRMYDIPDDWGTAVNVQTMVYGNTGDESRAPAWASRATPPAARRSSTASSSSTPRARTWSPACARRARSASSRSSGRRSTTSSWRSSARSSTRCATCRTSSSPSSAAACSCCRRATASAPASRPSASPSTWPTRASSATKRRSCASSPSSSTSCCGRSSAPARSWRPSRRAGSRPRACPPAPAPPPAASSSAPQDAVAWAARGEKVLLVRDFTSPDDIRGMDAAQGILTAQGGMTSHAALVARQMGKVCIVGCGALDIDMKSRSFKVDDATVKEGDWISIDGFTGEVILGELDTRPPEVLQVLLEKTMKPEESGSYRYYSEIMEWADKARTLGVRTNADQPDQSANAIAFGAEGIGLCRTEHMFFEGERIMSVREMILAESREAREAALAKLLPMQRDDFAGIFRVMGERHVTIRTLDPPLHEFLPHDAEDTAKTAAALGVSEDVVRTKVEDLHESNPMLGHRGCRLGIAFPEITAMQARAILEAACLVKKEGQDVHPEIMIPLVGTKKELEHQAAIVREVAADVFAEQGTSVDYLVGTMIEIPRAALTANEIAEVAEFFSFGTNDLTQMTLGVSRDDAGKFLPLYTSEALEIWPADPFATLDQSGVGQLVEIGIERGRKTRPDLKVGICGEQGGDPETVKFCHRAGMDYVSCSPFRLPVARLAAAQAAIEESGELRLEK